TSLPHKLFAQFSSPANFSRTQDLTHPPLFVDSHHLQKKRGVLQNVRYLDALLAEEKTPEEHAGQTQYNGYADYIMQRLREKRNCLFSLALPQVPVLRFVQHKAVVNQILGKYSKKQKAKTGYK
ncbi:glyoxylate/hydroxypyruvate reductase B, partial [Striga asiatica]